MTTVQTDLRGDSSSTAASSSYQTIQSAYRDPDQDLDALVRGLPSDRLNRLAMACRDLGRCVEVEILRRNGVASSTTYRHGSSS